MAVVNVKLSWSSPTLGRDRSRRDAQRSFTVLCDSPGDEKNMFDIDRHPSIPQKGQPHPECGWLYVDTVKVSPIGPTLYQVDVTYTTIGDSQEQAGDDPETIRTSTRWGWVESQEVVDCDYQGNPLTNTVGEGFDPPIQWTVMDAQLTFTRATRRDNGPKLYFASGSLNADPFLGALPGQAKMTATREDRWNGSVHYWEETFVITFRQGLPRTRGKYGESYGGPHKAWFLRVLNQGFRVWTGDYDANGNPIYREVVDADGKPVTKPVLLDRYGYRLRPTDPPHWLEFQMNSFNHWSELGLDSRAVLVVNAGSGTAAPSQKAWTQSNAPTQITLTPRVY